MDKKILGARIRRLRTEARMTQDELAVKLGCSKGRISHIELGKRDLGLSELPELVDALQCSVSGLFYEVDSGDGEIAELLSRLTPDAKDAVVKIIQLFLKNGKEVMKD